MSADQAGVEIRNLAESDLETVIHLAELLQEAPDWPPEVYDSLVRSETSAERIALVAVDSRSGKAIGFTVARLIVPDAELESIAVAQSHQRRGVGHQLLSALVLHLRQTSVETLYLEVRASNHAATSLYNSFEFSETGRRSRYYVDPVEDALLMTLQLV